ncbi:hypothetical protein E0W60_29000 (plasmid) [Cupriavidus oxalaticus]|uniref:Uncharacterized protein n=1 Tax=Cupriavidus oxalaticus TaxID=96344 RepID=A0A4P7LGG2_9BURK|nr:hypothetical protein E0W60_29000 [Cupriavidus oxalaticus]
MEVRRRRAPFSRRWDPGPHDVLSQILAACKAERAVTARLPAPRASLPRGTPGALAGMETIAWAFSAPASTPHAINQRQSAAIEQALALPNIREHIARLGSEPAYVPPQQATEFVRAQLEL